MSSIHRNYWLNQTAKMSDKERILMTLLMSMSPFMEDSRFGKEAPSYGAYWGNPQVGDIVKCETQRIPSVMTWAYLVEHRNDREDNCWLLREFGSGQTYTMGNESLVALKRPRLKEFLLEGHQFKFYLKVVKAFPKAVAHAFFSGIVWPDRESKEATIGLNPSRRVVWREIQTLEEGFGASKKRVVVTPKTFVMQHNSRTRIKDIAAQIEEHTPEDWGEHLKVVHGCSGSWVLPVQHKAQHENSR